MMIHVVVDMLMIWIAAPEKPPERKNRIEHFLAKCTHRPT